MDRTVRWEIPSINETTLTIWYQNLAELPMLALSYPDFCDVYSQADLVIETRYGLIRFDNIYRRRPVMHGHVWSPRAFRDVDTFTEITEHLFKFFGILDILVETPIWSHGLRYLLGHLGFHETTRTNDLIMWSLKEDPNAN